MPTLLYRSPIPPYSTRDPVRRCHRDSPIRRVRHRSHQSNHAPLFDLPSLPQTLQSPQSPAVDQPKRKGCRCCSSVWGTIGAAREPELISRSSNGPAGSKTHDKFSFTAPRKNATLLGHTHPPAIQQSAHSSQQALSLLNFLPSFLFGPPPAAFAQELMVAQAAPCF
jgi:hypothetical protein